LAFSQFSQARQQSLYPNPLRARAAYSTIQGGRLDIRTPVRADSTHQVRKGTPGVKVLKSRGPFALKIDKTGGWRSRSLQYSDEFCNIKSLHMVVAGDQERCIMSPPYYRGLIYSTGISHRLKTNEARSDSGSGEERSKRPATWITDETLRHLDDVTRLTVTCVTDNPRKLELD